MNKRSYNGLFWIVLVSVLISAGLVNPAFALEVHRNIQGPFTSGAEVTAACLKCHNQQAVEVMQSTHWTWLRQQTVNNKNTLSGKKDSLTAFAIDVSSNPSRCMGCHVSNTGPGIDLNASGPEMVDCLVCHDTTKTYRRSEPGGPADSNRENLELMARNVGRPTPANCTICHFADCGLPATDQSGVATPENLSPFRDIHLDRPATAFTCQDCHTRSSGHLLAGKIGPMNDTSSEGGCASCHTVAPHGIEQLNRHASTIACQTCHIPQYADKKPVIISWNWVMTGKTNRVYRYSSRNRTLAQDENGFTSATKIEPVYLWDDGGDQTYTRGQRINPRELTYLQRPSARTPKSKIMVFRVIYATQLYDTKYRYLISPLLQPAGSTLFPGADWDTVAGQGMESIVLPYSGEHAFAPTAALRRINHGVAPKAEALDCLDCHGSAGRMPWRELGYDHNPWTGSAEIEKEGVTTEPETAPEPAAGLQPVKELVIPPGLRF